MSNDESKNRLESFMGTTGAEARRASAVSIASSRRPSAATNARILQSVMDEQLYQIQKMVQTKIVESDGRTSTGLMRVFRLFDRDENGVLDRREFMFALRHLGIKFTSKQFDSLFESYDTDGDGVISSDEFIRGIQRKQEVPVDDIEKGMTSLNSLLRTRCGKGAQLRRLFDRYDRSRNGQLDLRQFKQLVRDIAGDTPVHNSDIEKVFKYFDRDTGSGITFEEFCTCVKGGGKEEDRTVEEIHQLVQRECFGAVKSNRIQGTILLSRHLKKYDREQKNGVSYKDFRQAVQSLGLGLSSNEIDALLHCYGSDNGRDLSITDFVDSFRFRSTYTIDDEYLQRMIKLISDGFVDHGHPLGKLDRLQEVFFGLLDSRTFISPENEPSNNYERNIELQQFVKIICGMTGLKVTEYEAELVYNYFCRDGLFDYVDFLKAINVGHGYYIKGKTWRKAPTNDTQSPFEVEALEKRLLNQLYSTTKRLSGTVLLLLTLNKFDKDGDGMLKSDEFIHALQRFDLNSNNTSEKPLTESDLTAIFNKFDVQKKGKIQIDEFVESCRLRHSVELSPEGLDRIARTLRYQVNEKIGSRGSVRVQELLNRYCTHPNSTHEFVDLYTFVKGIRRLAPEITELESELLFNAFVDDRMSYLSIPVLSDYILSMDQTEKSQPLPPPVEELLQKLSKNIYGRYSLDQKLMGARDVLRILQRSDADDDGRLNRKEFINALPAIAPSLLSQYEAIAVFDSLVDVPMTDTISINDFLRTMKSYQNNAIDTEDDLDRILNRVRTAVSDKGYVGAVCVLRVFDQYDIDGDGYLNYDEFEKAIKGLLGQQEKPMTSKDIDILFETFNPDGTGLVDFRQFFEQVGWIPEIRADAEFEINERPSRGHSKSKNHKDNNVDPSPERTHYKEFMYRHVTSYRADRSVLEALEQGKPVFTARTAYDVPATLSPSSNSNLMDITNLNN